MNKLTADQLLERKRKVLVNHHGEHYSVIIEPKRASPDGMYIELGDYCSDQLQGWYTIKFLAKKIVSVLKEWPDESI